MSHGSTETTSVLQNKSIASTDRSTEKQAASPILRSATYTELPTREEAQNFPIRSDSIRRSFSENVLTVEHKIEDNESSAIHSSSEDESSDWSIKQTSEVAVANLKHTQEDVTPKFLIGAENSAEESTDEATKKNLTNKSRPRHQNRPSVSGSFSKFARRSWIAPSRSPSPASNKRRSLVETKNLRNQSHDIQPSKSSSKSEKSSEIQRPPLPANGVSRRPSFLSKNSRQHLGSLIRRKSQVQVPSVPALPQSYSTEQLPSLKHKASDLSDVPAVPSSASYERLQNSGQDVPRRKDELWSAFRNLDGDFQKFQSRPSTTKTAIIRSSLLPFLRNYAGHPSNKMLRPEDLDRRTVILNKWWTGLLEMLNGRHGESVSGNDRPLVLEAASAIMVRPEWTLTSSSLPARYAKGPLASLKSRSTTSLGSTMSDFLIDSVFHNIRNTFTHNLLAQMAYVVQKMSTRNIPASVVAFCGKATAYAFFYCEGVASVLVRLWKISADDLRRVLSEYGFSRLDSLGTASDKICSSFPPSLHPLAFKTVATTARNLRNRPHIPIAVASIPWHGPWVGRWVGRDTDLFFVFTKHLSDLMCRCMPDELSVEEQIAAPSWILVQAQLMRVIQSNIQRQASHNTVDMSSPSMTADNAIGEANAAAIVLPLSPSSMMRSMAENRIIMLLRDCLSNTNIMSVKAQRMFADIFDRLLKAVAKRISTFDHNACFTLCDFLEEAIAILARYYKQTHVEHMDFDWSFWFEICQLMLRSKNNMTEIRVFAFLYNMWGAITEDEKRKQDVCLTWLLSREAFSAQFNHWCPMVRAYFMRLITWKVARASRVVSAVDGAIILTLWERLQENWLSFLQMREAAHHQGVSGPSTAPCSPAPGRQLLILRDDVHPAPSGMFLSFDGILSSSDTLKANTYEKHSPQSPARPSHHTPSSSDESNESPRAGKKRWDIIKSIVPFSAPFGSRSSNTLSNSTTEQSSTVKNGSAQSQTGSESNSENSKEQRRQIMNDLPTYRSLSFKFSLEWISQGNHVIGKEQRLTPPTLPPLAAKHFRRPHSHHSIVQDPSSNNKYVGRALAEWNLLIAECQGFFERRRAEGVPSQELVETPSLSVDAFRKI